MLLLPRDLQACENLFLERLEEPCDNAITMHVVEASVGSEPSQIDLELTGIDLGMGYLIDPSNPRARFEVNWETCIAYAVRTESYVAPDEYEVFEKAGPLRLYSRSHFLDFIATGTFATAEWPGPFRHYGIICQRHIIDVASERAPAIRRLDASEPYTAP